MTESPYLSLEIVFHGAFRVGTGRSRPDANLTADLENLLPETSLKGALRAVAVQLLRASGGDKTAADAAFGSTSHAAPWALTPVRWHHEPQPRRRARVRIDPVTGAAVNANLLIGEEVAFPTAALAPHATVGVEQIGPLPSLLPDRADHLAILACAAAGVHHLGGDRRRGLGWVDVTPRRPDGAVAVDAETITRLRHIARTVSTAKEPGDA